MSVTRQTIDANYCDRILRALSDWRRRLVLQAVSQEGALDLDTLTTKIVTATEDAQRTDVETEPPAQVRTSLHHKHLPKLAACDLIEYDPSTQRARTGDRQLGEQLEPVFDRLGLAIGRS